MIKTLIAQTSEIDEVDIAIVDIFAQLDLDKNLLTNSVGLIFCNLVTTAPNLLRALCQRFPFDVLGFNSPISASTALTTEYSLLTVMVLTSDDVLFSSGISENLSNGIRKPVWELYEHLASKLNNPPKLALILGPPQSKILGEHLCSNLTEVAGSCPIFGGLASDYFTPDRRPEMIFNGHTFLNRTGLILLDGDIQPRFSYISISDRKGLKLRSIVSEAEGNIIKQVNGMPILSYLNTLGMGLNNKPDLVNLVPIIITDPRGEHSKAMVIMDKTEEGHIICSFDIEENSTISLGVVEESFVVNSCNQLTEQLKWEQFDFCLILSCISRNLALGLNYLAEVETVRNGLGNMLPYVLAYTGGEIGPAETGDGRVATKFSNLALICCRF
jgi:hypothetical protein